MKEVILMKGYEEFDSKKLIGRITSALGMGDKVILDFNGVISVDFSVLERMITAILSRVGYEEIKTRFGFKNVNNVIRKSIRFIIDGYLENKEAGEG